MQKHISERKEDLVCCATPRKLRRLFVGSASHLKMGHFQTIASIGQIKHCFPPDSNKTAKFHAFMRPIYDLEHTVPAQRGLYVFLKLSYGALWDLLQDAKPMSPQFTMTPTFSGLAMGPCHSYSNSSSSEVSAWN